MGWSRRVLCGSLLLSMAAVVAALGVGSAASADSRPRAGDTVTVASLALGGEHTCALFSNGVVKCWGHAGTLGLGDSLSRGDQPDEMGRQLASVDLGTGRVATAISAGSNFTCALLDDGGVKCWGGNDDGQLGQGDDSPRGGARDQLGDHLPEIDLGTGRTAVAITAGGLHACALLDDSSVKCWGVGGALGLGLFLDYDNRGDDPGEMGDALPAVDLGTGRTVVKVVTGPDHTCAILDDSSLKCWGANYLGQLGLGDNHDRGMHPGEMGDALPAVDLGTGRSPVDITVGSGTTCARLDDASLKCWGDGRNGRLGRSVYGVGDDHGEMGDQLPPMPFGAGRTTPSVSIGGGDACAVFDDGTTKCWGLNDYGQLGQGDIASRADIPGVAPIDLGAGRVATSITAGEDHACAILDDASVKCWGRNIDGDLGLGDTHTRGDGLGEMGDDLPVLDLVPDQHVRRPDLAIKRDGGPWLGDDHYESTLNQVVTVRRERLGSVTFFVRVQNDSDHRARLTVLQMGPSDSHLARRYFAGRSARDISIAVLTGHYVTSPLEPGESATIRIEAHVDRHARHDHVYGIPLRVRVLGSDLPVDTVQAEVKVH